MSKELKALQEIREQLIYYKQYVKEVLPTKAQQIDEECEEELGVLETALKRLNLYDDIKSQIKELPPANIIYNNDGSFSYEEKGELVFMPKETYQKKLKALEIIKEKLDLMYLIQKGIDRGQLEIPQEEFDLLKEVLL